MLMKGSRAVARERRGTHDIRTSLLDGIVDNLDLLYSSLALW